MALSSSHERPLDVPGPFFIGGAYVDGDSAASVEHVNPSTGQPQATVPVGSSSDIHRAVKAAKAAQRVWMDMGPRARTHSFWRLGELLEANREQLAFLGARESGISVALPMMNMALDWVHHYMGWIDKIEGSCGESYPAPGFHYTRREPYGVVGVIIPWNGPLMATCMMALPAIAAGNGVVMKPPALAPFVALRIAELAREAGFPAGLFNVVPGEAEAGEALVAHPDVGKVTFTGGESVARRVMATAAACLKPIALELGGKSANLVFEDADLDAVAVQAVYGALGLSGQGCVNPTRLLVHRSRYDELVTRAAKVAASMKIGDPFDSTTVAGPVICQSACDRILGIIAQARREAKLVAGGGERLGGELAGGFFIQSTVFADVQEGSALEQNEVFGPVLSITPFADDAEALAIANGTRYGLGAYLHTNDLDRAHAFAERLDAGYLNINGFASMAPGAPFGGYRQSGFGRVGGWAGMEEYLQLKSVFVARRDGKR